MITQPPPFPSLLLSSSFALCTPSPSLPSLLSLSCLECLDKRWASMWHVVIVWNRRTGQDETLFSFPHLWFGTFLNMVWHLLLHPIKSCVGMLTGVAGWPVPPLPPGGRLLYLSSSLSIKHQAFLGCTCLIPLSSVVFACLSCEGVVLHGF